MFRPVQLLVTTETQMHTLLNLTNFIFSQRHIFNLDPVCQFLYHVEVGHITDFSREHAASIFRVNPLKMKLSVLYKDSVHTVL
jgi:hypothetical protein